MAEEKHPSLGNVVIAMYRPKPEKEAALRDLIARHVPTLRTLGLATSRPVVLLQASDGTYLEVFEWVSGGPERAHTDPAVLAIWGPMHEVAEFVTLADLGESRGAFPHFRPVDGLVR